MDSTGFRLLWLSVYINEMRYTIVREWFQTLSHASDSVSCRLLVLLFTFGSASAHTSSYLSSLLYTSCRRGAFQNKGPAVVVHCCYRKMCQKKKTGSSVERSLASLALASRNEQRVSCCVCVCVCVCGGEGRGRHPRHPHITHHTAEAITHGQGHSFIQWLSDYGTRVFVFKVGPLVKKMQCEYEPHQVKKKKSKKVRIKPSELSDFPSVNTPLVSKHGGKKRRIFKWTRHLRASWDLDYTRRAVWRHFIFYLGRGFFYVWNKVTICTVLLLQT